MKETNGELCVVYSCLRRERIPLPREEPHHPTYRGLWAEGRWVYYFFSAPVDAFFRRWIATYGHHLLSLQEIHVFPLEAWQHFAPSLTVGSFTIVSRHSEAEEHTDVRGQHRTIRLRPSVAFGSGIHPSTQACLRALEWTFTSHRTPIRTVWDVGTGSGILAFAALALGAELVVGSDLSLLAIREATINARSNNVLGQCAFIVGDGLAPLHHHRISLVVMNLEWPSLRKVLEEGEDWVSCSQLIIGGFPRFWWKKLSHTLSLSLFYTAQLFWVGEWGAAVIAQYDHRHPSPLERGG